MKKVEDRLGPYLGQEYHYPRDWCRAKTEGGTKFDEGKLRYDLIPPEALKELAYTYTYGAKKYGDENWKKGISVSRVLAAMMRHLEAYRMGEVMDPEGHSHMASVAWGAFALMWKHSRKEIAPTKQDVLDPRPEF